MGTIASLLVSLKANTADFDSKMKKSAYGLKHFEKQAQAVSSGITSAFVKLASVAGGISLFSSAADNADKWGEMAEVLGDSAQNMQALAFAAGQNDSSFDAVGGAMVKMQKNIVEASQGNKDLSSSFAALGLNTADLLKLNATDQFKTIATALNGVDDAAMKTNLGMSLFGKSYATVAVLVNNVSGAMSDADAMMKQFGLTDDQISKIKEMKDKMAALQFQTQALAGQLMASFGDALIGGMENTGNAISGLVKGWESLSWNTRYWIKTGLEAAAVTYLLNKGMVFSAMSKGVDVVFNLAKGWRAYAASVKAAGIAQFVLETIKGGWAGIAKGALMIGAVSAGMYGLGKLFNESTASITANDSAMGNHADGLRAAMGATLDTGDATQDLTSDLKDQAKQLREVEAITGKYHDQLMKLIGITDLDVDIKKAREAGADEEQITRMIQNARSIEKLTKENKFAEMLKDINDEAIKLNQSEVELKMIEAERDGFNKTQLMELRHALEFNEQLRKSKEAQKKIDEDAKQAVEDVAKLRAEFAQRDLDKKKKDRQTLMTMQEEADPTIKFKSDKGELDRLKEEMGMDDKTYGFQLKKIQDELKKNMGMEVGKDSNKGGFGVSQDMRQGGFAGALFGARETELSISKDMRNLLKQLLQHEQNRERLVERN